MNYYIVVRDKQGGEFGMHRAYTAEEWSEQAMEWASQDGSEDVDSWALKNYKSEHDLMCDIACVWDLEFKIADTEQVEEYGEIEQRIDELSYKMGAAYEKEDKEQLKKLQNEQIYLEGLLENLFEGMSELK